MRHLPATLPALPTLPSPAFATRFYRALAVLWASLCLLTAGALAQPTDAAQPATDVTAVAAPTDAVRVAVPPHSARVLDTTGTLHASHIAGLNEQILALEADTGAAVVVYMLPTTGEE